MEKFCERLVVGVIFLYFVLLFICIYQCYLTIEYRTELKPYKYASTVLVQDSVTYSPAYTSKATNASLNKRLDSISVYHANRIDSLSVALSAMKYDFIHHQENTLNDFRQETNNIINKLNGWFAFWIAILAILGGIIPLIIQYAQYKKSEDRLNESIRSNENSLSIYKNNVNICIQDCNNKLDDLNYKTLQMEVCSIIACIMTIHNTRMHNDSLNSVSYYNRLLYRLYEKFVALYNLVSQRGFDEEGILQIELALIQMQAVYINVALNLENRINARRLQLVIDEIHSVVSSIVNQSSNKDELIRSIYHLKNNLLVAL